MNKKVLLLFVMFLLVPLLVSASIWDGSSLKDSFNDTTDVNFTDTTAYVDFHNDSAYMGYELNFNDSMGDFGDTILSKWTQSAYTGGSYQYQNTFVTTGNGSLQFLNANLIKLQHNMFGSNQNGICDYFVTTDQSDSTASWGVSLANFGNSIYGRYTPASTTNWGYYTSGTSWTAGSIVMPLGISTTAHRIDCTGSTCNWYVEKDLILADEGTTALNEVTVGVGHGGIISTEYFDEFVCWLPTNAKDTTATKIYSTPTTAPIEFNRAECLLTDVNKTSGVECWLSNDNNVTWYNATDKTVNFLTKSDSLLRIINFTDPTVELFEIDINVEFVAQEELHKKFTITALDSYDAAAINNITVEISNSSFSFETSTENGTIILLNTTIPSFNVTYDVKVGSNESGGYLNRTFSINISNGDTFGADIYQSLLIINAVEVITGNVISDFNVSVPLQTNKSNATGFVTLFLKAGAYDLNARAAGYQTTGENFSITNLETNLITLTFGTANLTVNATASGVTVTSFNSSISLISGGYSETLEPINNQVIFKTLQGVYNVTLNSTDFSFASQTITISVSDTLPNITFELFSLNSINISIFDEETNELIDYAITTLILDHIQQKVENITSVGSIFLTNLFDGLWSLLASTPIHAQRGYIFTIVPQTTSKLNIYLLNSSNGELKTFTIKNKKDETLPDATVSISNKINNTFVTIAQQVSNFAGQVNIFLSSTNSYRFTVEVEGFTTKVFDLVPVTLGYTIIMDAIDTIDFTTIFDKISYTLLPVNSVITPSETQNFSIITSSEEGFINYFGLNSSSEKTNVSGSPSGGTASIVLNTSNLTGESINVDFFIQVNGEEIVIVNRVYRTEGFITPGNASAQHFADKYVDQFSEVFRALIVVLAAVAVILALAEVGAPPIISGMAGSIMIIAGAIIGWIPIVLGYIVGFITIGMLFLRRSE